MMMVVDVGHQGSWALSDFGGAFVQPWVTQFRFGEQCHHFQRHKHIRNSPTIAPKASTTFTMAYTNGFEQSIPHQQEKNLPGGGNWVVQKFGGTSVGKFAVDIAQDIVM